MVQAIQHRLLHAVLAATGLLCAALPRLTAGEWPPAAQTSASPAVAAGPTASGFAQNQGSGSPDPLAFPQKGAEPGAPQPYPAQPPAYVLPPLPDYTINEDWIHSPLLDRREAAPPGFFANVESSVLWVDSSVHFQGGKAPNFNVGQPATGGMPTTGDIIRFPTGSLNPAVSPRFELGYRFPDGFGEIRLGYRFLDASGSNFTVLGPPNSNDALGPADQSTRLALNIVDLDFGTREFSLLPGWQMRTAIGMRYASAYLNSQVNFLNPMPLVGVPFGTGPFTRTMQWESLFNRYFGPHAVFEIDRQLWYPGLSMFLRLDGSGMYGRVHQTFKETFLESPGMAWTTVTNGVGVPTLAVQVGFTYEVPEWNNSRFMAGYQYEEWWQFGRGNNDLSFGSLKAQGLYLRFEFNF
jgi:hypothetical protein